MQRSSDSIGTLAAALAKAQVELVNPEKSLVATIRVDRRGGGGTDISLCATIEWARHHAQNPGPTRNRHGADDLHRPDSWHGQSHDGVGAFLRGMDRLGLAGLRHQRDGDPASDGRGADLCPPLCALHPCRDCRRGRS